MAVSRLAQRRLALVLVLVAGWAAAWAVARPPGPPVRCGGAVRCAVSNAYGVWGDRKDCWASAVVYPTTEEEIRAAVARAKQSNQKVKVVSGFSHSIPKLVCPSAAGESIVISTAKLNSRIEVDVENRLVTADSGVGLRALIDAVEAAGLSLAAAPYWEGVSVGGMISTGSHGSSWWGRGGAVHDHLVALRLVVPAARDRGFAEIIELDGGDEAFNAAKVSLGLLGVISKVGSLVDRLALLHFLLLIVGFFPAGDVLAGAGIQEEHQAFLPRRRTVSGRVHGARRNTRVRRHHLVPLTAHGRVQARRQSPLEQLR